MSLNYCLVSCKCCICSTLQAFSITSRNQDKGRKFAVMENPCGLIISWRIWRGLFGLRKSVVVLLLVGVSWKVLADFLADSSFLSKFLVATTALLWSQSMLSLKQVVSVTGLRLIPRFLGACTKNELYSSNLQAVKDLVVPGTELLAGLLWYLV